MIFPRWKSILKLSLIALAVGGWFAGNLSAQKPPNIILIISDDHAWTDYGFMGHPQIETPNLDQLAANSVLFTRGYVPTALCRPALATLATGLYAHQHRITGNDPTPLSKPPGDDASNAEPGAYRQLRERLISLIDPHPTLPRLLAQRDYLSFQSGKWWEGSYQRGGFTAGMTRGFPNPGGRHGDDGLTIGRQGMQPIFDFIDDAAAKKQPFFVWYAPFLPHTPHNPPGRLLEKYQKKGIKSDSIARYYAMVEWFDETCGQLMDHLNEQNLRDNTLIVYIADNGWIQLPDQNGFAPRSKQSSFEGGVRQPILFHWPGVFATGDRGAQLCSSIDIFPTLLAAAGLDIPPNLPGLNLLPVLKSGDPSPRTEVFGEAFAHDIPDLDNPSASLLYRWVIEEKWKLILTYDGQVGRYGIHHPRTDRSPQLFDLQSDPFELQNLAESQPQLVDQLSGRIADWWPLDSKMIPQNSNDNR
jgi:arylsulfatase A-like enzyme